MVTGRYPLQVLMPNDHPLAERADLVAADLHDEPLIMGEPVEWKGFRLVIDRLFAEAGVRMYVAQEVSESVAIFGLVAAGIGISIYPKCPLQVAIDGVVTRPLHGTRCEVETVAVWPGGDLSQVAQMFREFLEAFLAGSQVEATRSA